MLASYFLRNRSIPQLGRTPGCKKRQYTTCLVFKSRRNTDLRNHPGVRSVQQGRRASARRLHARQAGQRGQRSRRQRSVAVVVVMMGSRGGGGSKVQTRVRVEERMLLLLLLLRLRLRHRRVQSFGTVTVGTCEFQGNPDYPVILSYL